MRRIVLILLSASCFLSASEQSPGVTLSDEIISGCVSWQISSEPTALAGLAQVTKLALSQKALARQLRTQPIVSKLLEITSKKTSTVFGALYLLKATGRIDCSMYQKLEKELVNLHPEQYAAYNQLIAHYKDAIAEGSCDILKRGIEQGVDPNLLSSKPMLLDQQMHPAIFAGVRARNNDLMKMLLEHPQTDVNYTAEKGFGYSLLHRAALYSTPEIVAQLIAHSRLNCNALVPGHAHPNRKQPFDCGQTPLVRVVYELLSSYDQRLVDNGLTLIQSDRVDVLLPDIKGRTALHYAALAGDSVEPIVRAISARHPQLNISQMIDARGKSPLWYAADYGHTMIRQALEEHEKNRALIENN